MWIKTEIRRSVIVPEVIHTFTLKPKNNEQPVNNINLPKRTSKFAILSQSSYYPPFSVLPVLIFFSNMLVLHIIIIITARPHCSQCRALY